MAQIVVAQGLDNPLLTNPDNCQSRCRIKSFYFEADFANKFNTNGTQQTYSWYFVFDPQGSLSLPLPESVGSSNARNYIFKQGKISVPGSSITMPVKVSGVVKIPPKYQRMMAADAIFFCLHGASATGLKDCYSLRFIYKEIRG